MEVAVSIKRPQVFVSYGGPDKIQAKKFACDLAAHGIDSFFAPDVVQGQNFVLKITDALSDSDYFALLVSRQSSGRPWVREEWSAALVREINDRRAFLFIIRLDDSPPPALLSARDYVDAFVDWDGSITRITAIWRRDWETRQKGVPVFPAPHYGTSADIESIGIYIFNQALSVQHFMRIDPNISVRQAYALVRSNLDLKDAVTAVGGKIGLSFRYLLQFQGRPLQEDAGLKDLAVKDGDCLDLLVTVQQIRPDGPHEAVEYRNGNSSDPMSMPVQRGLFMSAFGHLMP